MAIHATAGCAVQAQVGADAVTTISPLPPSAGKDAVVGAIVNVQGGVVGGVPGAAWFTVITAPATISVPARDGPVLGVTT